MSEKRLSNQYRADLLSLSTHLLAMGGVVEQQAVRAIGSLKHFDPTAFPAILASEQRINAMEREIDETLHNVIARRQPAARDLRFLVAVSKCSSNLERAADEAGTIGKCAERIRESSESGCVDQSEILTSGQLAIDLLRRALDAFARMDATAATQVKLDDRAIDVQFRGFTRRMGPYMAENPRVISVAIEYLFAAKAIERIGDHAKNIAELVVYVVEGQDIRHIKRPLEH
ncbi:phosphate signaling complex protein PhoU [Caballeronia glebae]|uniref:phosphate signaling complex protein PhoU n=1 Tax=Caballeronia glebae TaxID=1777143 RepID=UPI0038BC0F7E